MTELTELTPRQRDVAESIARAHTIKQIAATLHISVRRVRIIRSSIAYLIGANPALDEGVQIARWYREHTEETKGAA